MQRRCDAGDMVYHGKDGLHEGDEARVLSLSSDDKNWGVGVADRALRESFNHDGKVAVILRDELVEEVAGERVWGEAGIVGLVKGIGSIHVGPRPLASNEVVDVVPHPEELAKAEQIA